MTVTVFPRIIRDGLVVDYDPSYNTSFNPVENILTYSQQIDNGAWFKDNCTVTADSTIAPDGTTTGDTVVSSITGGNNNAFVNQQITGLPTNTIYTYSVYLKRGTSPTTIVDYYVASPYTEVFATVTWSAVPSVAYSFGGAATSGTLLASSFNLVDNGWYRLTMTMSTATGTALNCRVYVRGQGTNNVSGETVYVWGAQLEKSSTPSTYTATVASSTVRSTTLNNLVSASYPGTLVANTIYDTAGQGSFYFNDNFANYISAYTIPDAFWNAASWTVSAWYRPTTVSKASGDHGIIGHGAVSTNNGLHLGIRNSNVYFGFYGNDIASNPIITANKWWHLVWVYDYAQKQKLIYINGVLDSFNPLTGGTGYGGTGGNTELGRYPWGAANHMCSGYLGRVQMYSRPLAAPEVSQIFASMAGRYGYGT